MEAEQLDLWLLLGSACVIAAIAAVRLSHAIGLPSLLFYLGLGLLLGESGAGIRFDSAEGAQALGLAALVVILAEGGLTTDWSHVRPAIPAALALATVGAAVSIGVIGVAAHWLLGMDWRLALLLGAVLAPTDAAAVFSVLRRLRLPPRLAGTLEAESGLNDAPVLIAVVMLSTSASPSTAEAVGTIVYELVTGAGVGLLVGPLGAYALRRVALPASGLYPIAVMALVVGAYGVASQLHASGFLATYIAALVLGNTALPHRPATRGFAEGVAWLAQIGLFVMLGLLASPSELPGETLPALVIGFVLLLVARPLSVLFSMPPRLRSSRRRRAAEARQSARTAAARGDRTARKGGTAREGGAAREGRAAQRDWAAREGRTARSRPAAITWGERGFLAWAGLRGAVPIVLTTVPMTHDVPGADQLFAQVFVIVMVFTLLQGPTLPVVARWCRVTAPSEPMELAVEAAPLEELHADLLEVDVPAGSKMIGVEVFELRFPPDVAITLVVREGHSFVPGPTTALQGGDRLLVVAAAGRRRAAERRLRAVHRRGKLAYWFGERGE